MTARAEQRRDDVAATVIVCHLDARHFYLLTHCEREDANQVLSRQATCHLCGAPLILQELGGRELEAMQR